MVSWVPPAGLGSTAFAALGGPGSFKFHKGLAHTLLCVGQVHMGQVHLEGLGGTHERAWTEGQVKYAKRMFGHPTYIHIQP